MRLYLNSLFYPRLKHFLLERDGRDEMVYAGKELLFYRDGAEGDSASKFSLVSVPHSFKRIRSTQRIKPVRRAYFILPPLQANLVNPYWKGKKYITVVEDNGTHTHKAKINPESGIVWVNREFMEGLPYLWRVYILFHEVAHLWTDSEPDTDILASFLYVRAGYPPSQAAMALKYTLDDSNPEKTERRVAQMKSALKNLKLIVL